MGRAPADQLADEAEMETAAADEPVRRRFRPSLQPPRPNMDWPDWAVRTQRVQERLASTLERLIWGGIGALAGTAAGGVPAVIEGAPSSYPYVLFQPLGAAVGAVAFIVVLAMVRGGRKEERGRLTQPSAWTTYSDDRS